MKTEEKLRSAMHAFADSIRPEPASWRKIERRLARTTAMRWRPLVTASLAAAAIVALITIRFVGDSSPRGLELVSPTTTATPASPSPSPSPEPTNGVVVRRDGADNVLTSPDGEWTLRFPSSWHLMDESPSSPAGTASWFISTYEMGSTDVTDADILMSFSIDPNSERIATAILLEQSCPKEAALDVRECGRRTIDGKSWAYVVFYNEADPVLRIRAYLAAGTRLYRSDTQMFGATNHADRLQLVEEIIASFVIEGG